MNASTGHPLLACLAFVLSDAVAAAQRSLPESIRQLGDQLAGVVAEAKRLADSARDEHEASVLASLGDALAPAIDTARRIRERVGAPHLESSVEAEECLIRMRSAAVQLELAQLQRAEHEATASLCVGRFKTILDVSRFVLDLVGRINASVLRERAHLSATADEVAGRAVYAIALANAEWAFSVIGTDPDLVWFLAEGSHTSSDRIRASCQMLAVPLGASSVQRARVLSRTYVTAAACDCEATAERR